MPKGYAFMELADEEAAQIAMSMTGVQFMGRTIKVFLLSLIALGSTCCWATNLGGW